MKNFLKLLFASVVCTVVYTSCKKLDKPTVSGNGSEVVLSSSSSSLTPSAADSNNVVVSFTWTNPGYATDTANYKYVLEIDSAGRQFTKEATKTVYGSNSTTLTGRELNNILLNYGFTLGVPYELEVRLSSSYGNNNEKYVSNTLRISVTPFNDPSALTSSVSSVVLSLPDAALDANTFSWTPSFVGYTGTVTYSIQCDLAGAGFANPNEFLVGDDLYTVTYNQDQVNTAAAVAGIVPGAAGTLEYRLKAVTSQGAISYSNTVNLDVQTYISTLRFYMPGSYQTATGNGTDWTPGDAPEMIRDQRPGLLNNMYYIYIWLPAGAQFKFTQGQSWNVNYGDNGSNTLSSGGGNLSVAADGFYRISINVSTLQWNIMQGRMGFVGGATGAGWNPPNVFPDYALGNAGTNLFVGLTDLAVDGWKLIDNDAWNSGSNAVDETRSYGTPLPSGSTLEINGGNFNAVPAASKYRVIWDGRDRDNVTYQSMDASIMKVVGDGLTGVAAWNPAASPVMTYAGNNRWTITLGLEANLDFKFLAGADWGAFDYEDNSGQNNATGVAKKIKWEGGDNFKTPAVAGTYTIILDEGAQTVTIN
ncbi:MAG: SusE domain-containing protein [Ferruginibacter sp.]